MFESVWLVSKGKSSPSRSFQKTWLNSGCPNLSEALYISSTLHKLGQSKTSACLQHHWLLVSAYPSNSKCCACPSPANRRARCSNKCTLDTLPLFVRSTKTLQALCTVHNVQCPMIRTYNHSWIDQWVISRSLSWKQCEIEVALL